MKKEIKMFHLSNFKKVVFIILCVVVLALFVQRLFTSNNIARNDVSSNEKITESKPTKPFKVGIVLSIGGLGDKSYNDSAYKGVQLAVKKLGIEFDYIEPSTTINSEVNLGANHLRQYAKEKYDLVIATGFLLKDGCEQVAREYPDVKFILIDSIVDAPNVTDLVFKAEEGSFLVGSVAGLVTKTNVIGYIGAQDIPFFRKFQGGYMQGVSLVNPKAKVISKYVNGLNPFLVPNRGNELANELIDQGADVIYTAAGSTGIGAIEACKKRGVYAIGVDNDQDYIEKGTVITSMVKKVDKAVYDSIELAVKGNLKPGILEFGVSNGGTDTSEFLYTKAQLPAGTLEKINGIKKDIISGKIKIKTDNIP
ncbi:MAG: BMP family ABC transporter substrate-binding protein [Clostridiaceae bacterium]|nr:BMP family ABC transporter substrate-binding protein [Clostridiaceae bacterium]